MVTISTSPVIFARTLGTVLISAGSKLVRCDMFSGVGRDAIGFSSERGHDVIECSIPENALGYPIVRSLYYPIGALMEVVRVVLAHQQDTIEITINEKGLMSFISHNKLLNHKDERRVMPSHDSAVNPDGSRRPSMETSVIHHVMAKIEKNPKYPEKKPAATAKAKPGKPKKKGRSMAARARENERRRKQTMARREEREKLLKAGLPVVLTPASVKRKERKERQKAALAAQADQTQK